jgi:hypothetical protein
VAVSVDVGGPQREHPRAAAGFVDHDAVRVGVVNVAADPEAAVG